MKAAIVIIILLAVVGIGIASIALKPELPATEIPNGNQEKIVSEQTDLYNLDITYPSTGNTQADKDIETYLSGVRSEFMQNFEGLGEEDKELLGFNDGRRYTFNGEYEIKESEKLITYVIQGYYYTGGAHEGNFLKTFTYNKATNNRIVLDDLFTAPTEEYLSVLAALADKEFTFRLGDAYFFQGAAPQPENWSNWFAENTSITFIFPQYQVAPYASGEQRFRVKTGGILDLINEAYFLQPAAGFEGEVDAGIVVRGILSRASANGSAKDPSTFKDTMLVADILTNEAMREAAKTEFQEMFPRHLTAQEALDNFWRELNKRSTVGQWIDYTAQELTP